MKKPFAKQIIIGTMALTLMGGGGYLLHSQDAYAATADTTQKTNAAMATHQQPDGHFQGRGGMVTDDLLTFLKLDKTAFEAKQAKGESLAQIATDQGISRDALKAELTTEENNRLDKEKTDFAQNLDKTVDSTEIGRFNGPGGPGRPAEKNHGEPRIDMSETAKILGLTEADLKAALTPGKSIADLATAKGVTVQTVIDLQVSQILKNLDQDLANGKITQAEYDKQKADSTNIATTIVNDKHDGKGEVGGHGRGNHGRPGNTPPAAPASK